MQNQQPPTPSPCFYGEVSKPASHPRLTKGFVQFYISITSVGQSLDTNKPVELVDQRETAYPVAVRGTGSLVPDLSTNPTWKPGDFLLCVDGITMEQAYQMRYIRQKKQS